LVLSLLVVVLVVSGGFLWVASQVLLQPDHDLSKPVTTVKAVTGSSVELATDKDTATVERDGVYGLDWPGGHAVVGAVTARADGSVTRTLAEVTGTLRPGTKVFVDPDVWPTNPQAALGVAYREVTVHGPLGRYPAWQVAGTGSTWVLFVHGVDGTRAGGLRPLTTVQRLGLPTLLITYRGDQGAPWSLHHLGMTEWQDLDAAAAYAQSQGATKFVLYGDSMGGSIVTRFMHESSRAGDVVGMVLDAPVLNWGNVLWRQAAKLHLAPFAYPYRWLVGWRVGVNWSDLNEDDQAASFKLPILLFQGLADGLVPPDDSSSFCAGAADCRYVPVPGAGHIQSWNVDPVGYDRKLARFLGGLTGRPVTTAPETGVYAIAPNATQ
jgi:hypothetical protein